MPTAATPEAIADISVAIQLNPEDGSAFYSRGVYYRESGEKKKARADLKHAKQLGFKP